MLDAILGSYNFLLLLYDYLNPILELITPFTLPHSFQFLGNSYQVVGHLDRDSSYFNKEQQDSTCFIKEYLGKCRCNAIE
jgi:hypothetical protein